MFDPADVVEIIGIGVEYGGAMKGETFPFTVDFALTDMNMPVRFKVTLTIDDGTLLRDVAMDPNDHGGCFDGTRKWARMLIADVLRKALVNEIVTNGYFDRHEGVDVRKSEARKPPLPQLI
jgi:hypothetical protein